MTRAGRLAFVLAIGVGLCSCSPHRGFDRGASLGRPGRNVSIEKVPVRGFETTVEYRIAGEAHSASGELLAADEVVWLAIHARTVGISSDIVREVTVEVYPSTTGALATWTALGTVSTISHGVFLIFTGPIWLASGVSSSVSAAARNDAVGGPTELSKLYEFARFPGGLPRGWPRGEPLR